MTIAALKALCSQIPWCEPAVLESVLELALEIAAGPERSSPLARQTSGAKTREREKGGAHVDTVDTDRSRRSRINDQRAGARHRAIVAAKEHVECDAGRRWVLFDD